MGSGPHRQLMWSSPCQGGKTMYEHYLFFESEGDPTRDPVIMWTNGGPGASSFFGSFSELGSGPTKQSHGGGCRKLQAHTFFPMLPSRQKPTRPLVCQRFTGTLGAGLRWAPC
mmetsp:Transcript_172922/g.554492  ORF Transcript_172922/g.554492 Transcript_172922/m.554492 type:complete len:113 (-) Transcript_172922:1308-1646(-)